MAKLILIKHHANKYNFDMHDLMRGSAEVLASGTYKVEVQMCTLVVKWLDVKMSEEKFKATVEPLGAMKHPNVIRPLAYCCDIHDKKLVVYKYMSKGSLSFLLHENGGTPVVWDTRCRITLDVACGISYIHSTGPDVCHGNIKSSNILLNEFERASVSDCGLRFLYYLTSKSSASSYGWASQRSDVYSFGILLLELLTRKSPSHSVSGKSFDLPCWIQSVDQDKWSSEVLDVELIRSSSASTVDEMMQMLQLGMDCTNQNPDKRPSMKEVVSKVEEICRFRPKQSDQEFNQHQEFNQQPPLPNPTSPSSSAGKYKHVKFKLSSLLPFRLPNLRSASSAEENHKIDKLKQSARIKHIKWDGITTFAYSELVQATSNFSKSNELGRGGFGKVYKGHLRCTKVAIKILHREGDASQEKAFRQEVDTLCRVSHPHLVRLLGVCPKRYALVYEFLEGGTLEDRLVRKDIPSQDRVRIAAEICSALVFLHSRKPEIMVHGDLKPANILLDASGLSKLGDFGICRIIPPSNTTTTTHITATSLQGSHGYMDPVLKQNSKLKPSIDVYAFGMIVLRLLTNERPGHGLVIELEEALSENRVEGALDPTARWPSQLAEELSDLAVKCCDLHEKRRPQLQEVWEKLEEMSSKVHPLSHHVF